MCTLLCMQGPHPDPLDQLASLDAPSTLEHMKSQPALRIHDHLKPCEFGAGYQSLIERGKVLTGNLWGQPWQIPFNHWDIRLLYTCPNTRHLRLCSLLTISTFSVCSHKGLYWGLKINFTWLEYECVEWYVCIVIGEFWRYEECWTEYQ